MGVIVWIIFGVLIGWIAPLFFSSSERRPFFNSTLASIVGALVGGFMMNALGFGGITSFNPYSLIVSIISAFLFLGMYHAAGSPEMTR